MGKNISSKERARRAKADPAALAFSDALAKARFMADVDRKLGIRSTAAPWWRTVYGSGEWEE